MCGSCSSRFLRRFGTECDFHEHLSAGMPLPRRDLIFAFPSGISWGFFVDCSSFSWSSPGFHCRKSRSSQSTPQSIFLSSRYGSISEATREAWSANPKSLPQSLGRPAEFSRSGQVQHDRSAHPEVISCFTITSSPV